MGQRIFKPIKIPFIFNSENIENGEEPVIENHTEVTETIDTISQFILTIVENIYNEHFKNTDKSNDLSVDNLCARTSRKRPLDKVDNEVDSKIQKWDTEIKFFTDIYSLNDLATFLSECLNNDDNLDVIDETKESIERSPIDVVLKGSNEEINTLTKNELKKLFQDKILFKLSEDKNLVSKLKLVINSAAKNKIITDFIDDVDDNKNPAISIALLNSNLEGFCYLLKRKPKIPTFIYLKNKKVPFLNYIAMNAKIRINKTSNDYILSDILKTLIDDYEREIITNHLCEIDSNTGLSLPHLLLIQYQHSPDLRSHLTYCLKLCIDNCPKSLKVMCTSLYCSAYKFSVIAHSLILPETNYEIIKAFMKLDNSIEELSIYRSLVLDRYHLILKISSHLPLQNIFQLIYTITKLIEMELIKV